MSKKVKFTSTEKNEIVKGFEDRASLRKLMQKNECSSGPIVKVLIEELGLENYKKIAKEHRIEQVRKMGQLPKTEKQREVVRKMGLKYGPINGPKNWIKWNKEYPEEHAENCRKNGRKSGPKNVIKMNEANAKNHIFTSRPEALFYIIRLTKNFYPKDIVPQYYIKELRHYVDFAIPNQKLLFEVDGDNWHGYSNDPIMNKERFERDAQIDKWAEDNGWTMFRFNDEKMRKCGVLS